MNVSKSAPLTSAEMVLRTATLLDDYARLGTRRKAQLSSEIQIRATRIREQKLLTEQENHNVLVAHQKTTLRIQQAERELIGMKSQIDSMKRERLNQIANLQSAQQHLQRVQMLQQQSMTEQHILKTKSSKIDFERKQAEKAFNVTVQQIQETKDANINLRTSCRHKSEDLSNLRSRINHDKKKLNDLIEKEKENEKIQETIDNSILQTKIAHAEILNEIQQQTIELQKSKNSLRDGKEELAELEISLKLANEDRHHQCTKIATKKMGIRLLAVKTNTIKEKIAQTHIERQRNAPLPLAASSKLPKTEITRSRHSITVNTTSKKRRRRRNGIKKYSGEVKKCKSTELFGRL
jgi:chromosome segregation ATPase